MATNPDLVTECSDRNYPLMPDEVNAKSQKNVWWKCRECGYEWRSVIHARVKGTVCPVCVDRAINLGVGLAMQNKKVLLVDADPQGDLTTCLGWRNIDNLQNTISDKMLEVIQGKEGNQFTGILRHKEGVDLLPSNSDLFDFETSLVTVMNRDVLLKSYLSGVKDKYDYILIDCSPSLGMMTLNSDIV